MSFSTHGFNRTGLIAISYLCEYGGLSFTEASRVFASCRGGDGVYRHEILDYLFAKYGKDDEAKPDKPELPIWIVD